MKQSDLPAQSGKNPAGVNKHAEGAAKTAQNQTNHQEIELKLTGNPTALSAIFEKLAGSKPRPKKVVSTYYDTSDHRLRRKGYSLRLRKKGETFDLTLKCQADGSLKRGEWTSSVREPIADIGALPAEAPRGEIGLILPEELQACFTTEIARATKVIVDQGTKVEIAYDTGRITSGNDASELAELEFELMEGDATALLKWVKAGIGQRRFAVGALAKADRGWQLVDGAPPGAVKAEKPKLEPDDTVESAVGKIVAVTVAQIIANLPASEDGRDPEGVHQLRVALRRLKSALTLFRPHLSARAASIGENASRAMKSLGPARDLDVFLLETMPPVMEAHSDTPGLVKLAETAEAERVKAYQETRRLIGEARFNRFILDLLLVAESGGLVAHHGDQPLKPIAISLLRKRLKKVLRLGRDFENLPTPERHEVRIALKKFRYACDFFQALFPQKETKAYLKRLASLQDDLGWLNDASVAEILVDTLAGDDQDASLGAALIKGWYGHRVLSVEPHMLAAWNDFSEARPFWLTE